MRVTQIRRVSRRHCVLYKLNLLNLLTYCLVVHSANICILQTQKGGEGKCAKFCAQIWGQIEAPAHGDGYIKCTTNDYKNYRHNTTQTNAITASNHRLRQCLSTRVPRNIRVPPPVASKGSTELNRETGTKNL